MARRDDDDYEDDDRPRRPKRRRDDDDFEDAPPRSRSGKAPATSGGGTAVKIVAIIFGTIFALCAGAATLVYVGCNRAVDKIQKAGDEFLKDAQKNMKNEGESNEIRDRMRELSQKLLAHERNTQSLPGNSYDPTGKPLLSWRVHLLSSSPEHLELYRKFNLQEPWDSPTNIKLLDQMPGFYSTGASRERATNKKTYFRGYSGPGGAFQRANAIPFSGVGNPLLAFPDGIVNTVLVFEAADPIEWTKPDQLINLPINMGGISPQNPHFFVIMGDGLVKKANRTLDPDTVKLLLNRQDAMIIPQGWEVP